MGVDMDAVVGVDVDMGDLTVAVSVPTSRLVGGGDVTVLPVDAADGDTGA